MKIYYAHHIWKYNTVIEKYELELIKNYFPCADIINPNGVIDQSKTEESIMDDCYDYVRNCDGIVFSSLSGVVGKGVVSEIDLGYSLHKPIFYITDNAIKEVTNITFEKIEQSTTNRLYAIVKI